MRRSSAVGPGVLAVAAATAILLAGCGSSKSKSGSGGSSENGYSTSTSTTSAAAGNTGATSQVVIATKSNPVLETTILAAGPKKLTVYMFEADHQGAGTSACYAACAAAWPPVLTSGSPKVEGGASATKLGTLKRSDGTTQVTYAGWPLYYYSPDSSESDITGQGISSFGALWYVLSPAGQVVKKS
jgi:predicted lipoprotein with Yx(FWY)xxD motif